jgi:hypothetical protein
VRRAPEGRAAWRSARFPRGVGLAAAAAYAVELAVPGRYGYQRDELYFLAAGQHLSAPSRSECPRTSDVRDTNAFDADEAD